MTDRSPWYVRGLTESHQYDFTRRAPAQRAYCASCEIVHDYPLGNAWHIEGPGVTEMLCGLRIEIEDGAVQDREPKNVCQRCQRASRRRVRAS